jgi:hypothetical protein
MAPPAVRSASAIALAGVLALALAALGPGGAEAKGLACPAGMVPVRGFCIDSHEAGLEVVTIDARGRVRVVGRHSPFEPVDDGALVRAVSAKGRVPQGHVSQQQAAAACRLAGKRLCTDREWITACKGKRPTTWPYGEERVPGRCNDEGTSGMNLLFGAGAEAPREAYTQENMNDPRLNRVDGSLAVSGRHKRCKSSYGAYDMVGNLHEWTAAAGGTFRGGYYLDVTINGEGCEYKTTAHSTKYFDYSTGFRCCWSPGDDAKGRAEVKRLAAAAKKAADAKAEKKKKKKADAKAEKKKAARAAAERPKRSRSGREASSKRKAKDDR